MEFSDNVLNGLSYLANASYIADENYKKLVNSCLGLITGEENIERVSNICPEKSEIIKQAYAALLTFTIEVVRNLVVEEVKPFLTKQNFKSDRIDYYLKVLNASKENIVSNLNSCHSGWPNIVDAQWRLDYIIKSNLRNHMNEALYYIVLTTEKEGKFQYIKFTCNWHQLQDLSIKLKEIVLHIEKISFS